MADRIIIKMTFKMKKHIYNILPEMSEDEFQRLKNDIQNNKYDHKYPIYLYNGDILDGWNRQRACDELNITPPYRDFEGTDAEAWDFVMRSINRRNLTSEQYACIAILAKPIIKAIQDQVEKERRAKQAETQKIIKGDEAMVQKIAPQIKNVKRKKDNSKLTKSKVAKMFKTNRTYINEVAKIKDDNPVAFEQIKNGEKTIADLKKEEKAIKLELKKAENVLKYKADMEVAPEVSLIDCNDFLKTFDDDSIDLLFTDPPYSTDVPNIAEFTESWLSLAIQKTKKTGRMLIFSGSYPKETQAFLNVLMAQDKFIVDNPLIWTYKNTLGVTPKMKYNLNYQMIWHLYSDNSPELDISVTNEMFSVMEENAPDGRQGGRLHMWQKPIDLAFKLVRQTTKEDDLVVDPFTCTGTFIIAANTLGRIGKGCDIDQENLNIAISRGCQLINIINNSLKN
jgi:DNA modification methylase